MPDPYEDSKPCVRDRFIEASIDLKDLHKEYPNKTSFINIGRSMTTHGIIQKRTI